MGRVAQKYKSLEAPSVVPSMGENGDIPQARDGLRTQHEQELM